MIEPIQTERLLLVPVTPEHVDAFFKSRAELGKLLGAAVPDEWPVAPEIMEYWREKAGDLDRDAGWAGYFFVQRDKRGVIGDGGFKRPPDTEGTVEIGYAVVPAYRRQGYGTEAVKALIAWAFNHPELKSITAETLPRSKESMRLLEKLGFSYQGIRQDTREGMLFLWQMNREEYGNPPKPPETDGCPYS